MDIATKARTNMVLSQVVTTSNTDEVLRETMMTLPRHLFVPPHLKSIAYLDDDLALGNNRYMISPALLAKMIRLTEVSENDTVLDIAITTGYSTAVFAKLANKVIGIEPDHEMASKANCVLHSLGINNSIIISSSPLDGHPDSGPYNIIFFNGAVESVPATLTYQLAEGGRLVTVLYKPGSYNPLTQKVFGMLTVIERCGDYFSHQEIVPVTLFPLVDFSNIQ